MADHFRGDMKNVLRWINGKFRPYDLPDRHLLNIFFESNYKHMVSMQVLLSEMSARMPFFGANVRIDRVKDMAFVHDLPELFCGRKWREGMDYVLLEDYRDPYIHLSEEVPNPAIGWDVYYCDIPFENDGINGGAVSSRKKAKKRYEKEDFFIALDEYVEAHMLHSDASDFVKDLYTEYDEAHTIESQVCKYIDRYSGIAVGLKGPFDYKSKGYRKAPRKLSHHVLSSLANTQGYYMEIQQKLASYPYAQAEFSLHFQKLKSMIAGNGIF